MTKIINNSEILSILKRNDFISGDNIRKIIEKRDDSIFIKCDRIFSDSYFRGERLKRIRFKTIDKKNIFIGYSDITVGIKHSIYLNLFGFENIYATNTSSNRFNLNFMELTTL